MKYPANPKRFVDLPADQDPHHVGLLVASVRAEPDQGAQPTRFPVRQLWHRQVERRTRRLRFALVGAVLFLVGGVVGAAVQPFLRSAAVKRLDGTPEARPSDKRAAAPKARGRRPDSTTAEAPSPLAPAMAGDAPAPLASLPAHPAPNEAAPLVECAATPGPTQLGRHMAWVPSGRAGTTASGRARADTGTPFPAPRAPSSPSAGNSAKASPAMENAAAAAVETAVSAPLAPPPAVSAPVSPPVAASPTAAPSEQSLLTAALEKLRAAHEPRAALALLDEYRRRFPTGAFAPEAARLRTEALLLVGRKTAALDELEGGASSSTSPDERRVLRGELRAAAGRWQAACADFDDVVRAHAGAIDSRWTDLVERALWGRASCRGHLGDETATKADLREYLHRFPDGRFAKQASRLLGAGE